MARSTPENLLVLFEDNHLIAVSKRPGDLVQGDKTGDQPLSEVVKSYIKKKYQKPGAVFLGVIHRLDRPTSGLVIFARTSKALSRMNALFAEGKTRKSYRAIVGRAPDPPSRELVHYLQRNPKQNKSYAFPDPGKGRKRALLSYETIQALDHYYMLDIALKTGRHHQIRAQLAAIGCPIKGDLKYGAPRSNPDGSIHLHARQLAFIHPVRKTQVSITAPYPREALWDACK